MGKDVDIKVARKAKGAAAQKSRGVPPVADEALEKRILEINQEFGLVLVGDAAVVLRETVDFDGKPIVAFLKVATFLLWLEKERVWDAETERFSGLGMLWKKHPKRRDYDGVVFAPEGAPLRFFNLWRGFAFTPAEPYPDSRDHVKHFPTFYEHMRKNVAQGNDNLARWLWAWFAHMIQKPTERIGTAVALRGKQGSGKSKVGEVFGALLGRHSVKISKPKHLTGSFNAHMLACLLLRAEEGFWAGDKEAEGVLKDLVSSDRHYIEKKGLDAVEVRNLIHLLVTSNSDWVVPAAFEERRFAVVDVGDGNLKDAVYFAKIDREMKEGGFEHLLAYLLAFDLGKVDVRTIPATAALLEQKMASMSEIQAWWLDRLREGALVPQQSGWREEIAINPFYESYVRFAEKLGKQRRLHKEQWAIALRKMLPRSPRDGQKVDIQLYDESGVPKQDMRGQPITKRVNGYKNFPTLAECRAHFAQLLGEPIEWGDEGEGEGGGGSPPRPAGGEGGHSALEPGAWEEEDGLGLGG
jgi:hypothetical protein